MDGQALAGRTARRSRRFSAWRLPPFHATVSSRLVKTPKLHFIDPGLACYLLGIRSADHLRTHPLRGAVFETWVASEILKRYTHAGRTSPMTFFRSRDGAEVDIVLSAGSSLTAVEAKSGLTAASDFFRGMASLEVVAARLVPPQPGA
jgi:predicted AAA+ superfamily ATPase